MTEHAAPSAPRTALVAGASGLVGGHLLEALLADDTWTRVTVLARRPLELEEDPKLAQVVVDFDDLAPHADRFAVDEVFCCLGTTLAEAGSKEAFRRVDHDYPVRLAELARDAGAERFLVVSSLGAHPASRSFYLRVKGEMEAALGALGLESLLIFRPSFLVGERAEARPLETFAVGFLRGLWWLMIGPLGRFRPIPARTVARAMVAAARTGRQRTAVIPSDAMRALAGG